MSYLNGKLVRIMLLAMILGIALLLVLSILVTNSGISKMEADLGETLNHSQNKIKSSLNQNLSQITVSVENAKTNTSQALSGYLTERLEKQLKGTEQLLRDSMLKRGEVMADTLSKVSIEPILGRKFAALMSFVKVANNNPNVVYAFYLRPNGKPYTRYVNRKNPLVKELLTKGQGRSPLDKLIDAASKDENIIQTSRDILFEGEKIASIKVAMTLQEVNQEINTMRGEFQALINDSKVKINQVLDTEAGSMTGFMQNSFASVNEQNSSAATQAISFVNESASRMTMNQSIYMILLGLVIMLLLAAFFIIKIIKPINELHFAMNEIAEGDGDLSHRLPEGQEDEVSLLAVAFNKFVIKIEGIVTQLSNATTNLNEMVTYLTDAAKHTSNGMTQQQEETARIEASINDLTQIMHQVAGNTTDAADEAHSADNLAGQGKVVVTHTVQEIDKLANAVQKAGKVVSRVDEDSKRISTILDVIRGIAEQTNLLALNAAIEAARAGEQGRGFAVVADEVRTLAQRSQESTQEIQEMIDSLQTGVRETVDMMSESQDRAHKGVEEANKTGEMLTTIKQSIDSISTMNAEIAQASKEQQNLTDTVNTGISNISVVAKQTSKDAVKTSNTVHQLADMVNELVGLVQQFHVAGNDHHDWENAKLHHKGWKDRLSQFLDGYGSMSESEAIDHHNCKFGQWYYSVGKNRFSHIPEVAQIEQPHKDMHEAIKQVLQLKQKGEIKQAQQLLNRVENISGQIVELIDVIERKV